MGAYQWAGVAMPWRYDRPLAQERAAVRERCGIVDASQLRVIELDGPDSADILERLLPRAVSDMPTGTSRYSVVLNRRGRIVDELLCLRIQPERFWLSAGAGSTRERLAELGATMVERDDLHVLAVQGPRSAQIVGSVADTTGLAPGDHREAGPELRIARAGFTGEQGYELYLPADAALATWRALVEAGAEPYGYATVDLLRIEAGFLLYPNDLAPLGGPADAGLGWLGRGKTSTFTGREATEGRTAQARIGGILAPGAMPVPRGTGVSLDGELLGRVTSSAYSPAEGAVLCLAQLATSTAGRRDTVGLGDGRWGQLVALPFVTRRDRDPR